MKKRIISALVTGLFMLSTAVITAPSTISPLSNTASAAVYGNWTYDNLSDGTIRVTDYSVNNVSTLTIPRTISGKTVTEIGGGFLSGNRNITKVNLPYDLKTIHFGAFRDCSNLSYVTFSNTSTLLDVKYTSFFGTPYLDDPNLDNPTTSTVVLGKVLISYHNTNANQNVTIESFGAKAIGSCVFFGKSNIKSLNLKNVVRICEYGVFGCSGLTTITNSESLNDVSDAAFSSSDLVRFKGTDFEEDLVSLKARTLLKQWGITPNYNMDNLQKYTMVQKIAEKFKTYYTYDSSIPYAEQESAASLIFGKGTCKGISLSFWTLLKQAGFKADDLRGCGNFAHAWNIIKIYDKWYYLDMTSYICGDTGRFLINSSELIAHDSSATNGFSVCYCDKTDGSNRDSSFNFYICTAIRGDLNGDGYVNSTDKNLLKNYLSNGTISPSTNIVNADLNRDAKVDFEDLALFA